MSDSNCSNRKLGDLLSAYELGLLSESDTERFEEHLIGCEYCYSLLKDGAGVSDLLLNSQRVQNETEKYARASPGSSTWHKLKEILWPDIPFPFRPAITLTLLILLSYHAYLGLTGKDRGGIRQVQSITLLAKRSAGLPQLDISSGRDGLISVICRQAKPDQFYIIRIESGEGQVLFTDPAFDGFDEFGVGSILIPFQFMRPGLHRLVIHQANADSEIHVNEYPFNIIE